MASPGELQSAVALCTGNDEVTERNFDRQLLINGLRTKGGRGTSAAKMQPKDAANLLIATLAQPRLVDVASTVRLYRDLGYLFRDGNATVHETHKDAGRRTFKYDLELPDWLSGIHDKRLHFGDTIEHLIWMAIGGHMQEWMNWRASAYPGQYSPYQSLFPCELIIEISRPTPSAEITLVEPSGDDGQPKIWFNAVYTCDPFALPKIDPRVDRRTTEKISHRTLLAIGDLLNT